MTSEKKDYHKTFGRIRNLLDEKGCWCEVFEHDPVRTSEEAAEIRTGYTLSQGAKAIIIKAKKSGLEGEFLMLVFPADQKFDSKKVRKVTGAKSIRFATQEETSDLTDGVEFGGVPPFGNLFGLEVIVDESLFDNEKIVFNAGDRRVSIGMKSQDYRELVRPRVERITK